MRESVYGRTLHSQQPLRLAAQVAQQSLRGPVVGRQAQDLLQPFRGTDAIAETETATGQREPGDADSCRRRLAGASPEKA